MTVGVVDTLEVDDIDESDGQPAERAARPIDLVFEVDESRASCPRSGERVGFRDRELAQQRRTVLLSLAAVASSPLAVARRLETLGCRTPPSLCRRGSVLGVPPAIRCSTFQDFAALPRQFVAGEQLVPPGKFEVVEIGGVVTFRRRSVALGRDCIAFGRGLDADGRGMSPLFRAVIAKVAGHVVHARITTGLEVPIARSLIRVGGRLVAVGGCLVAVRTRLVGIRVRLIAIGSRLHVVRWLVRSDDIAV